MDIRFVRLEDDVCDRVNRVAEEAGRTVSDLVNQILREHLRQAGAEDVKPAK